VTRELFRTRVTDGILGDIRFDRYGDLVDSPLTVVRIVRATSSEERLRPGRRRSLCAPPSVRLTVSAAR
jgi:hypothetical protein